MGFTTGAGGRAARARESTDLSGERVTHLCRYLKMSAGTACTFSFISIITSFSCHFSIYIYLSFIGIWFALGWSYREEFCFSPTSEIIKLSRTPSPPSIPSLTEISGCRCRAQCRFLSFLAFERPVSPVADSTEHRRQLCSLSSSCNGR